MFDGRIIRCAGVMVLTLSALFSLNGVTTSVQAAETLVLRRSQESESIDVADLKTLVGTETTPLNLEDLARILSAKERRQITNALQAKFNLNAVDVRNFLNTQVGDELATALARATPRADRVGVQAMKTALVLGANAPEGLSLISFIEAYPKPRLELNLDEAFEVVENFNGAFWQTQAFMAAIAPQLAPRRSQIDVPFDASQPGRATVQVLSLNLNDAERGREIPLDVYWSTEASPTKPLIVFSHGLGSVRTDMRYLAEHLASHGYVVVALEHPGSNGTHIRNALRLKAPLLEAEEFLNRPKDISFVLDELQTLNQNASSPLQGKLASDRVMVVGYSLGAATALSVAGAQLQLTELKQRCPGDILAFSLGETAQCFAEGLPEDRYQLRDSRIKAAIALSPTTSLIFGETGLSQVAVPTLIVAASADKTTPALTEQIIGFDKMPSPKWLVGIVGGTHLSVKDPSTTTDQAGQLDTLYTGGEVVGEQAVDVRNYVKAIALAMAAQLIDEASQYAIFLTPEYAQFASTKAFPIRLVTEIPPEAEAILQDFRQHQAQEPNSSL
ncbi:MAG: alpha/beta hydrolase [Symplocastrum torsivum CPER-KK1]|jgi:predicted dienelactone hydrolase|uniref:Alpha/beta hydrolase n=1 Tax=Symplocastrum torsivum CPER-KK1 TaxID=450513 RepID=A0A951PU44_9CYAN|nr:alpha/beta hydrolase [Symplocastrum torsivum CPER-KK1]